MGVSTLSPEAPVFNPSFSTFLPAPCFALSIPLPPVTASMPLLCRYTSLLSPSLSSFPVVEFPRLLSPSMNVECYPPPSLFYSQPIVENLHVYFSSPCSMNPYPQASKTSAVPAPKASLLPLPDAPFDSPAVAMESCTEPTANPRRETARRATTKGGFGSKKRKVQWKPKRRDEEPTITVIASKCEFNEEEAHALGKTTAMIRNIPNKFSRRLLVDKLRKHCLKMNNMKGETGTTYEFDFIYLPMDFNNCCNLGYAFVNFTTTSGLCQLYREFHNQAWDCFGSKKICEIGFARLQGFAALKNHFCNSNFTCTVPEYLPMELSPPCDGSRSFVGSTVGRLVNRSGCMRCS